MLQGEAKALSGKRVSDTSDTNGPSEDHKSDYELVRYPSGQSTITKRTEGSSYRDVIGNYTNDADAQKALDQLAES